MKSETRLNFVQYILYKIFHLLNLCITLLLWIQLDTQLIWWFKFEHVVLPLLQASSSQKAELKLLIHNLNHERRTKTSNNNVKPEFWESAMHSDCIFTVTDCTGKTLLMPLYLYCCWQLQPPASQLPLELRHGLRALKNVTLNRQRGQRQRAQRQRGQRLSDVETKAFSLLVRSWCARVARIVQFTLPHKFFFHIKSDIFQQIGQVNSDFTKAKLRHHPVKIRIFWAWDNGMIWPECLGSKT